MPHGWPGPRDDLSHHRHRGEATAADFVLPNLDDRLVVKMASGDRVERLATRSSFA